MIAIDMLNHKRPRQTSWTYSDEKGGFIIEALDDIPRGEQVLSQFIKPRYTIVMGRSVTQGFCWTMGL